MTWALLGRWLLARLPQILVAAGAAALIGTGAQWWAGVRAAPLRAEIVRLQAQIQRHEDAALLAARTAALALAESRAQADAKYQEDAHEIERLLEREAGLLAAADAGRTDLARRLREQWSAGRAAGRRDRDSVPSARGDRQSPPAAAAAARLVPGPDPADPDRFDLAADVALTAEQTAAVARVLIAAAREGRCIKLTGAPHEHD